jgi:hypothetical protein
MRKLLFKLRQYFLKKQLKMEIANATKVSRITGKTMLIFFVKGEYKAVSKQEAKRIFKHKSNQEIEKLSEIKITAYDKGRQRQTEPGVKT